MIELGNITALVIDPQAGMRGSIRNMLNQYGITKIDEAISASTAMRALKSNAYDVILCEYDLAEGQDGQQLLEDLRYNKIIPLSAIFVMVTAEHSYEKVVSAAEQSPTAYLLKPFAADTLLERLTRAIDRRALFLPVYRMMDDGNQVAAIQACIEAEAKHPAFATDFMRLRAELHIVLGQAAEAEFIYKKLIGVKAIAWARLGLAKALFMQNRFDEAETVLESLISDNKRFLDAYDWLAKTRRTVGRVDDAMHVLESAVAISPHTVTRLRRLGEVAMEAGDVAVAEKSFQQVVSKARYSEFRDPEDHVKLVQTLVQKGDVQLAATVVRDLEKSFAGLKKTEACRAFSAALIHGQTGDSERAAKELSAAVAACRDGAGLSNDLKLELAKNCLENKLEQDASQVMLEAMNNASDSAAMVKAMKVFELAGRKDLAESVAMESRKQVVTLVSTGAEKAKQGDFHGAVDLMTQAASKFPDNPQVVFNAALALLKCLENLGWDNGLGRQARWYIESCRRVDPTNPRLTPLADLYQSVLRKYGIMPSQVLARLPGR
jgi:DNA-binding NarL/FixJ family response regulator